MASFSIVGSASLWSVADTCQSNAPDESRNPSPIPRDRPNCSPVVVKIKTTRIGIHHRSHGIGPIAAGSAAPSRRAPPAITDPTGSAQLQRADSSHRSHCRRQSPIPRDRPNCSRTMTRCSTSCWPSPIPRDRPNCSDTVRIGMASMTVHHRSHGIGPIAARKPAGQRRSATTITDPTGSAQLQRHRYDRACGGGAITDPTGSAQLQHQDPPGGAGRGAPITDPTGSAQLQQVDVVRVQPPAVHHRSHGIGPIAADAGGRVAPGGAAITDPTGSAQSQRFQRSRVRYPDDPSPVPRDRPNCS